MAWLTAEIIQAIGVAFATVITAWTAHQAREVRRLRERVEELEQQQQDERQRFRAAAKVIRQLRRYADDLCDAMRRAGLVPPPSPVVIPPELAEEI
ncbi:hypothetical protein [Nocardia puris]|uniref:Uncharacterized protein n=1 Tax=Nocardia puris TaxID=208602 RepID=A0A366CXW9_9NOCA|nr:hypothetical protein [Nocardia puris]RBO82059.1 hypothetical protein DFR74_12514 [Nocardia puris]